MSKEMNACEIGVGFLITWLEPVMMILGALLWILEVVSYQREM